VSWTSFWISGAELLEIQLAADRPENDPQPAIDVRLGQDLQEVGLRQREVARDHVGQPRRRHRDVDEADEGRVEAAVLLDQPFQIFAEARYQEIDLIRRLHEVLDGSEGGHHADEIVVRPDARDADPLFALEQDAGGAVAEPDGLDDARQDTDLCHVLGRGSSTPMGPSVGTARNGVRRSRCSSIAAMPATWMTCTRVIMPGRSTRSLSGSTGTRRATSHSPSQWALSAILARPIPRGS
jgi:hypothetical protein